ncbi:MAG: polymerase [Micavibrio sp.]|nr:polymerase [Micavibrio sp.]
MKLTYRQIDGFVKKPDPAARAILIYGPDEGMMRERSSIIGKSVVADLNDPFNVAVMTGDALSADPARLNDEANAMSMMGGARLIRVEAAGDSLTPILKDYLKNPSPGNLVIIEGHDLASKSSLRRLFETAPNAAAIPCYTASAGDVQTLIRQELQASGHAIDPDAIAWLGQHLTGDRALARNEIEKLLIYMGAPQPGTRIRLEDVQACCGQDGEHSLDDLIYATAGNQPEVAIRTFKQLVDEGTALVVIQRSLQTHFRRLHFTRSLMENGKSQMEAMNSLNPKIFFKWEDSFRNQVGRWPINILESTLNRLASLEADCKKTGVPDEVMTAQAILSLSARK